MLHSAATLEQVKVHAAGLMGYKPELIRLWDMFDEKEPKLFVDSGDAKSPTTLEDAQVVSGQSIFVEAQLENGRWIGVPGLAIVDDDKSAKPKRDKDVKSYTNGGMVGLYNLGNTCFMNSGLQCLSFTRPLTDYFLSDVYVREINQNNPLGAKGQVALHYGRTLKDMWSARVNDAIAPRAFKATMGKIRVQFAGNQQQDAQELLAFLLVSFSQLVQSRHVTSRSLLHIIGWFTRGFESCIGEATCGE
jgi:hypothetical protein